MDISITWKVNVKVTFERKKFCFFPFPRSKVGVPVIKNQFEMAQDLKIKAKFSGQIETTIEFKFFGSFLQLIAPFPIDQIQCAKNEIEGFFILDKF